MFIRFSLYRVHSLCQIFRDSGKLGTGLSLPRSSVASLLSRKQNVSASLEATPRRKGQTALPLTRPPYGGINANHSSTAPGSDGARPPSPTVAMTGVPSANSGHCFAISDAVAALWEPATQDRTCSHSSRCYSANSGCPDSTSPHVWPRTRPLLGKGSGVATCPSTRDAQH